MIVVTIFLSNYNQMEFYLVQNRKKNCRHDHNSFNLEGIGNLCFRMLRENIFCLVIRAVKYLQGNEEIAIFTSIMQANLFSGLPIS